MPKEKGTPDPVISTETLEKITTEIAQLVKTPRCAVLEDYFKKRVLNNSTMPAFIYTDYDAIKAIFPQLDLDIPNIDKILEYYIVSYPAYQCLGERYYSAVLEKNINEDNENQFFRVWFKEFYCYLKVKCNDLKELAKVSGSKDAGTMPRVNKTNETTLPDFSLEILGPNNIINNLVFTTSDEDVQVRYHRNTHVTSFNDGGLNALINYPNIEVSVNICYATLPSLVFTRTCECDYNRFIVNKYSTEHKKLFDQDLDTSSKSKSSQKRKSKTALNCKVISVELLEAQESIVYHYGFISEYLKALVGLIKTCRDRVPELRKQEFITILNEFLADIAEIDMYNRKVIATNTAVKFKLGSEKFERYRFVQKSDINFIEVLQPMINLQFNTFNPLHAVDAQKDVYFRQLRTFAQNLDKFEDIILADAAIVFKCTQCGTSHNSSAKIIEHFSREHEPEVGVVCEKCKLSLEVSVLAANRWKHTCFE